MDKKFLVVLIFSIFSSGSAVWYHPRQFARLALFTNAPRNENQVMVGYMNTQISNANACQMATFDIPNQIAIGSNMFHPDMCGQEAEIDVGDKKVQGIIIDALDDKDRVMVSSNLFDQFSDRDVGIVSGTICLPYAVTPNAAKSSLVLPVPNTLSVMGKMTEAAAKVTGSSNIVQNQNPIEQGQIPIDPAPKNLDQGYQHVLYQSNPQQSTDASFYFSADGLGGICGKVNNVNYMPESDGFTSCEPNTGYKTLRERNNDNIVAIPLNLMNKSLYCGKKVIVTINGKERDDLELVIWD
ncbi:MAG: hypothetical protein EOP45_15490, partial [Sphingobacteriaceae bacterium]